MAMAPLRLRELLREGAFEEGPWSREEERLSPQSYLLLEVFFCTAVF